MPVTTSLNAAYPVVFNDGTMQPHFRDFILRVDAAIGSADGTALWGGIAGTLSDQTDLQAALDLKSNVGHTHAAADIISGTLADARVAQSNVTQHEAALAISWSQVGATPTTLSGYGITDAAPLVHTHAAGDVISGTFADARISEASVTQHEAALSVSWSQLSGQLYVPPAVSDDASATYTLVAGDANKAKRFTAASPAITIPTSTFSVGDVLILRQAGTGTLALTTTGFTVNGTVPSWAQHVEVKFRYVATDTLDVV